MLSHHLSPPAHRRLRTLGRGLAVAASLSLVAPAIAAADSIVYLKAGNVWLAEGDGSGEHQVTRDGGATAYASPTQADDGTIAVGFGPAIRLLKQNGTVIREFDAPTLTSSASSPMDGSPYAVAISPDGARIAYTFARYECPIGASCMARSATGFVDSSGKQLPGNLYNRDPSWLTNTRILTFGGFGSFINIHDQGQAVETTWIEDHATDLGDGEISPDGRRLAAIYGYGDDTHLAWYDVPVDPRTTIPTQADHPQALCQVGPLKGIAGPTWAPSSDGLAWTEPDGIWTKTGIADCANPATRLAIPGGSEPDWGPAAVNPGAPPATDPPKQSPGGPIVPAPKVVVGGKTGAKKPPKLGKALKSGVLIGVLGQSAGNKVLVKVSVDAKTAKKLKLGRKRTTVATGKGTVGADGAASVKVTFTKAAKKRLAKQRKVTFKVSAGNSSTTLTLKR